MTLAAFIDVFPGDEAAEAWFIEHRWRDGVCCARFESVSVGESKNRRPRQWRCRDRRKGFWIRTGTLMRNTKLEHRTWALGIYLDVTNPKGVSSTRLHRDLGVCCSTSWHRNHRIREGHADYEIVMHLAGP